MFMRLKKYCSFGFAILIFSILMGSMLSAAYTQTGYWPISVGEQAYYLQTSNQPGAPTSAWSYYEVTSISDGVLYFGAPIWMNLLNGTFYLYNENTKTWDVATQVGEAGKVAISGYNASTNTWIGAFQVLNRQPSPAPVDFTINDIKDNITEAANNALDWLEMTVTLNERTVIVQNSTQSIEITYNTENICTMLRYNSSSNTIYWQEEFKGSEPPDFDSAIPGYNLLIIIGLVIVISAVGIRKKFKSSS
jgi:hypothetical protein